MAIELISTVIPKNGQDFAIVLANDIQGGLHSVHSITERNNISSSRLQEGMLCYVRDEGMFQYIGDEWVSFSQTSYVVNTQEELLQIDTTNLKLGTICYVIEEGLYYLSVNGWSPLSSGGSTQGFHIGDTPPEDTSFLWIDTRADSIDSTLDSVILDEFRNILSNMTNSIVELTKQVKLHTNTILQLTSANDNLKQEIRLLKDRVYRLENNMPSVEGDKTSILTEDGFALLCEDGTYLLMDDAPTESTPRESLLCEDGKPLLTEDNVYILQD